MTEIDGILLKIALEPYNEVVLARPRALEAVSKFSAKWLVWRLAPSSGHVSVKYTISRLDTVIFKGLKCSMYVVLPHLPRIQRKCTSKKNWQKPPYVCPSVRPSVRPNFLSSLIFIFSPSIQIIVLVMHTKELRFKLSRSSERACASVDEVSVRLCTSTAGVGTYSAT